MNDRKVAYFHGCFANYYDPAIGQAFVGILDHLGVKMVAPNQVCCGLPLMAKGNLKGARKNIEHNQNWIRKVLSDGYTIVTTCPSCNLFLQRHYFQREHETEMRNLLSENIMHFSQYLLSLPKGKVFNELSVPSAIVCTYHEGCHIRAANIGNPTLELLKQIPRLEVALVIEQCCGMGGAYGLDKANKEIVDEISNSLRESLQNQQANLVFTDCGGCKLQIEKACDTPVTHPVVYFHGLTKRIQKDNGEIMA